jgi:membrane protein
MLKAAFADWQEDKAPRLGAALSYYTIFSLAPLLVIAITIAGFFFGAEGVRGRVGQELHAMLGPEGGAAVDEIVASAGQNKDQGILATIVGIVVLLVGATGVFAELKAALNTVWEVEPKPGGGIMGLVRDRLSAFAIVACIGFLLLVSLLASTMITAAADWLSGVLAVPEPAIVVLNALVALVIVAAFFAVIFKVLPDAQIAWRDVWIGAIITAVLFSIGKLLIGLYLGNAAVGSAYGAAGSLVIVLVWTYYSAQILLFGAEFTQVYARRAGAEIRPTANAQRIAPPCPTGALPPTQQPA